MHSDIALEMLLTTPALIVQMMPKSVGYFGSRLIRYSQIEMSQFGLGYLLMVIRDLNEVVLTRSNLKSIEH